MGLPAAHYTSALRKCRRSLGGCHIQLKRHLHAGKRFRDALLAECSRFGVSSNTQAYLVQVRCRAGVASDKPHFCCSRAQPSRLTLASCLPFL